MKVNRMFYIELFTTEEEVYHDIIIILSPLIYLLQVRKIRKSFESFGKLHKKRILNPKFGDEKENNDFKEQQRKSERKTKQNGKNITTNNNELR